MIKVDLDWSSYAGKRRHLPWFVPALLLLAQAGHRIFIHGAVVLVWPEGLIVNRIPIRWKHLPVPMLMGACFSAWLAIHQLATDIGEPTKSDNDPDTNDDLLYPAIDFENETVSSVVLCLLLVFVLTPLVHWLLWSLSLFGTPCDFSGRNRRYVSGGEPDSTSGLEEAKTNDSVSQEP